MEISQLLALPCQSLVLLALAKNLVTTGSKVRLAEWNHVFQHATPPVVGPLDVAGPSHAIPAALSVNLDQTPVPATAFSEVHITQLRLLILAAVLNKCAGLQQPPGLAVGSLLSPATTQPQPPSAAVQTGLQNVVTVNPAIQVSTGTIQHGVRFICNTRFQAPTSQFWWNALHLYSCSQSASSPAENPTADCQT